MPECEFAEGCNLRGRLFRSLPRLVQEYEGTYCDADRSQCARYMVASEFGPEKVPLDLLPFQIDRAKEAIAGIRKWSRNEALSSVTKKDKPMKKKRSGSDRRTGVDRRQSQVPYTGPERRRGKDRRSGIDRRNPS